MTIFSKNVEGRDPFGPPGYAYGCKVYMKTLQKMTKTNENTHQSKPQTYI